MVLRGRGRWLLRTHQPTPTPMQVDANINFGSPRVGNPAWAAYYNALVDDSTDVNATAARDALRVQIGTSGDLAAAGADTDSPANATTVPRWSAVQLAAVTSAMGGAAAHGVALSAAEVSAVRAVMSAARTGGHSLAPATLRVAATALARLPVAAINRAALARSLPAAPAPPVSFRLVHHHDIVPHLGPEDLNFEHGIEGALSTEQGRGCTRPNPRPAALRCRGVADRGPNELDDVQHYDGRGPRVLLERARARVLRRGPPRL